MEKAEASLATSASKKEEEMVSMLGDGGATAREADGQELRGKGRNKGG